MTFLSRDAALTIDDKRKIDRICTRFEDEWLAGRRPAIEPFLRQIHLGAQNALLRELLLVELDYRRSLREPVTVDDYLRRFPRLREVIREAFELTLSRVVPARFLPGTRIGRYEVRRTLGAGAFAVVYLAWDGRLEREVAVKVPHSFLLADDLARQRFLDEARTVAQLRHPRIVALHDVAELADEGTIYLVMQYIAGESLQKRLRRGPVAAPQASRIAQQVADAMAAAHRAGVFHRDLKPSNILLDEEGQSHVCDFGLALHVDQQRGRRGELAGTLAYMAPEQLRGDVHQLDGRVDVWALGVIHYEMLTGRVPFEGCDRDELSDEILHRDPRPPRQLDPRIPPGQQHVCLRSLAKLPNERYATSGDVASALRSIDVTRDRRRVLLVLLLAAALLSGTMTSVALWLFFRLTDGSTMAPLHASLELRVWDVQLPDRQGVRLVEAGALPLHDGDRLRIHAQLNQTAYLYLLWVDAQGIVSPVYPWRQGEWDMRPDDEQPRMRLALPDEQVNGLLMRVEQDGWESLLLLARHSPLPDDVDLPKLLAKIPRPPKVMMADATWFQDGSPIPVVRQRDAAAQRPPVLSRPVEIHDPLLQMQRRTSEILRPYFELVRTITFPVKMR